LAYLGNRPAESFASFEKQVFTIVNSQTAYTLSHSVVNENDIRLVVNNVVQEPGSGKAYTASGTTLTLSAALTNGTDTMYCVFLGRALQTVNPPNASVGSAQVADDLISGKTALGATPADTDELLISDAGTLKRVDYSYLKSANTPAFLVFQSSNQSISNTTSTILQFGTENIDTDNAYSSNRFTVPTGEGGLYHFALNIQMNGNITGANIGIQRYNSSGGRYTSGGGNFSGALNVNIVTSVLAFSHGATLELNAGDYVEATIYHGSGSTKTTYAPTTWFGGYKLIGV
jgi:hypothetical protein